MNSIPPSLSPTASRRIGASSLGTLWVALWISSIPGTCFAQDFTPQFKPILDVPKTPAEIRIDGELDDPGWQGAARAREFSEVNPGDQVRPPVDSEAWITYDDRNLYVALVAYDDPGTIRVSWKERDNIFDDDYFGLMLDTYGDHAWGYEFFVNPLGLQGDLRIFGNGDEDISFDQIWSSKGRVTEHGYQVELAIPFRSLRFPPKEKQVWRANFWRDHQRSVRRKYAWAATNRDDPCWMCQWGTLRGISDLPTHRDLEAIANAIGYVDGARDGASPSTLRYKALRSQASLNLRYSVSSTSAAELSLNPDFSQIESDAGRIDVNEPFAYYYSEKRPFFQEGSELYNTFINAVYTRSVFDPDQATKVTGRLARGSFVWTAAHDRDSPVILPLEERSLRLQARETVSNIVRAKRNFGEDSHLGALMTDRRLRDGGSGTLAGLDASVRWNRHFHLAGQGLLSYTQEPRDPNLRGFRPPPAYVRSDFDTLTSNYGRHSLRFDGETLHGHALFSGIYRDGRDWNGNVEYSEFHPDFRADNGFVTRVDYRQVTSWNGLQFRRPGPFLLSWQPAVSLGRIWDYSGRYQDEWLIPSLHLSCRYQTELNAEYLWSKERFRETMFPGIRRFSFTLESRLSKGAAFNLAWTQGRTIRRSFAEDPVLARNLQISAGAAVNLTDRLVLRPDLSYFRLTSPNGAELLYDLYILRNRLDYQANREISVRLVNEYDKSSRTLSVEPLLTWRINPFSFFYLGMSDLVAKNQDTLTLVSSQVFAKLQYLVRV